MELRSKSKVPFFAICLLGVSLAAVGCDSTPKPTPSPSPSVSPSPSPSMTQAPGSGGIAQLQDGTYYDSSNGAAFSVSNGVGTFYTDGCDPGVQLVGTIQVNADSSLFGGGSAQINTCNGPGFYGGSTGITGVSTGSSGSSSGYGGLYACSDGSTGCSAPVDSLGIPTFTTSCTNVYNFVGIVNSDTSIGLDVSSTQSNAYQHYVMTWVSSGDFYTYYATQQGGVCPGVR